MSYTTTLYRQRAEQSLAAARGARAQGDPVLASQCGQAARHFAALCRGAAILTSWGDADDVAASENAASQAEDYIQAGAGWPPSAAEVHNARAVLDNALTRLGAMRTGSRW